MSYSSQANLYATRFGKTAEEVSRIYQAVLYGQSFYGMEQKEVNDPVTNKAFDYAMSFRDLNTEEKFRIQQAVKFGATLPLEKQDPMETTTPEFDDNTPMPFGKHKGKAMANVPAHYFLWLLNEGCSHAGVKKYILDNLDGLKQEAGKSKVRY